MIKNKDMEITIDFGGFYGYHEQNIYGQVEMFEIDDDSVDYTKTFNEYAIAWLDRFNKMTDLGLEFVELWSPKYYNYTTDKIIAKVDANDVTRLNDKKDAEFIKYLNERCKQRSGFIPFYDGYNDIMEAVDNGDEDVKSILYSEICNWLIDEFEVNEYIEELEYEIIEK